MSAIDRAVLQLIIEKSELTRLLEEARAEADEIQAENTRLKAMLPSTEWPELTAARVAG